jgi:hypothetical protein
VRANMNTLKEYDLFNHAGIEKAAFFLYEHDRLTPKKSSCPFPNIYFKNPYS